MPEFMDKLLVSTKEAARLLSLSERSVYFLIQSGRLPSRKIGARRLVPREAVEKFATRDCGRIRPKAEVGRASKKSSEGL